ncbi:MAG: DUF1501 domain-containing protein [Planctomycetes bacterium]|nr:DUF1501 domain-containing protein [Planctomycetota bacterium]
MHKPPSQLTDLLTRRAFLGRSGIGFGAAMLGSLLSDDGRASVTKDSLGAQPPHFAPRAKSVIYLHMVGAPSQLDLFEHKPELEKWDGQLCPDRFSEGKRFAFIRDVLAMLSEVPAFRIETRLGQRKNFEDWPRLLRWWLAKETLRAQPTPRDATNWYAFVAQNFVYRGAWGLGSIIGLLFDTGDGEQPIRALEIEDWPRSGLPWIAFWIKELITWGTLDPVAAFLLARGNAVDPGPD